MSIARPLHPLLHRVIVATLVLCGLACCCRDRALAAWWTTDAVPAQHACCGGCAEGSAEAPACDDPPADSERNQSHPPGACRSSCCTKAGLHTPSFEVAHDRIGTPLVCVVVTTTRSTAPRANEAARVDEDVGEPPPWRRLLDSARLRV
ncbi:MAG: hypothetical protein GC172_02505 [Phycisphaera sp.]|nr:hypothetical protein [Phycisphaera sp.]